MVVHDGLRCAARGPGADGGVVTAAEQKVAVAAQAPNGPRMALVQRAEGGGRQVPHADGAIAGRRVDPLVEGHLSGGSV